MIRQATYSDEKLDDLSRGVFFKCMTRINDMLDGVDEDGAQVTMNYEKMDTLAHVADSAACGFKSEEDNEI